MPAVRSFEIHFDNPAVIYYAGQTITGEVILVLTEPLQMRGVLLKFRGQATIVWSAGRQSSELDILNQVATVHTLPKGISSSNSVMPIGTHKFQFNFPLPPSCPGSFEGTHGNIRYWVEAKIVLQWKFGATKERLFTVLPVLDLNLLPDADQPAGGANEKDLCCMCCVTGHITFDVNLSKYGYVPSELLAVEMRIQNRSTRRLKVTIHLLQDIIYILEWGTLEERASVNMLQGTEITLGPRCDRVFNRSLLLPEVPPTMTDNHFIVRRYTINCVAYPSGCSCPLTVSVPIIVGTVPVRPVKL